MKQVSVEMEQFSVEMEADLEQEQFSVDSIILNIFSNTRQNMLRYFLVWFMSCYMHGRFPPQEGKEGASIQTMLKR